LQLSAGTVVERDTVLEWEWTPLGRLHRIRRVLAAGFDIPDGFVQITRYERDRRTYIVGQFLESDDGKPISGQFSTDFGIATTSTTRWCRSGRPSGWSRSGWTR
jgi:hypothetical protein